MSKRKNLFILLLVAVLMLAPLSAAKEQDDHQERHASGALLPMPPAGSGNILDFPGNHPPHGSGAELSLPGQKPPHSGSGNELSFPPLRSGSGALNGSGSLLNHGRHFGDVNNHWAREYIELLANDDIVAGDGTNFNPDSLVTRAEFVKILVKALDYSTSTGATLPFTDVPADAWFTPYVKAAYVAGWINGYADNTFKPNQPLTRAEAAAILVKALKMSTTGLPEAGFTDTAKLWANKYINALKWHKLVSGYDNEHFGPDKNITRAEAAKLIVKARQWLNVK